MQALPLRNNYPLVKGRVIMWMALGASRMPGIHALAGKVSP
jgi:hypothetical protein